MGPHIAADPMVQPRCSWDVASLRFYPRPLLVGVQHLTVPSLHLHHSQYGRPGIYRNEKSGGLGRHRQLHLLMYHR